jgi:hypothetical protein
MLQRQTGLTLLLRTHPAVSHEQIFGVALHLMAGLPSNAAARQKQSGKI